MTLMGLLVAGCMGGDDLDDDGGKADRGATGRALECVVVRVNESLNAGVLEEGLGSIYDFDEEGYPGADGDSLEVSVARAEGKARIGQRGFDAADGDLIEAIDEEPRFNTDVHFLSTRLRARDDQAVYTVRVFSNSRLGVVLYQDSEAAEKETLAALDCRGTAVPTFE